KGIDLKKTYAGKDGVKAAWKPFPRFRVGQVNNLKFFDQNENACVYLYHEIEVAEKLKLPVSVGSDDGVKIWLNGTEVLANNVARPAAPDQDHAVLPLRKGKNRLLVKVCNLGGDWAFYIRPEFPPALEAKFARKLDRDFPGGGQGNNSLTAAEAKHYRLV